MASNPSTTSEGSIESLTLTVICPKAGTVVIFVSGIILIPLLIEVSLTTIVLSQGSPLKFFKVNLRSSE